MKRLISVLSLSVSTVALSEPNQNKSYFCNVEIAGGLAFNTATKKWQGATFSNKDKFVLKLEHIKTGTRKNVFGQEEVFSEYYATLTEAGANDHSQCFGYGADALVVTSTNNWIECKARATDYRFNLRANRFTSAYNFGYSNGVDDNKDTPHIAGGVCTRIN